MDRNEILIQSLKIILEQDPELQVVGFAKNGETALKQCEALSPDIVLVDVRIPLINGIWVPKLIKERYNSIKILIMTTFDEQPDIKETILQSADGLILKDINEKMMIALIKTLSEPLQMPRPTGNYP